MYGRRASNTGRSHSGSNGGLYSSENAGMRRFLEEGSSAPSKSGAKVRPKGVADAQTVDIPLPPKDLSTGTL